MVDAPSDISQGQFVDRIRALLPDGWFPSPPAIGESENAPVLNGLLQGAGAVFEGIWTLFQYVYAQQRMATALGAMLDLYAVDLIEGGLERDTGETDASYRKRIYNALFPARFTRAAIEAALTSSWGDGCVYVEPRNASDTKGLGSLASPAAGGGYGYGETGLRYGSRLTPFQGFALLMGGSSLVPSASVTAAIENVRAGGLVIWVTNVLPTGDFAPDIL